MLPNRGGEINGNIPDMISAFIFLWMTHTVGRLHFSLWNLFFPFQLKMEIEMNRDDEATLNERRLAVALGLAIGDCLGDTSEFQIPWCISHAPLTSGQTCQKMPSICFFNILSLSLSLCVCVCILNITLGRWAPTVWRAIPVGQASLLEEARPTGAEDNPQMTPVHPPPLLLLSLVQGHSPHTWTWLFPLLFV